MGSWGYKALESDEGLDLVDFMRGYIPDHLDLKLSEIIIVLKESGSLGKTFEDIDFYYDHTAMALTELYLIFLDEGSLECYDDEDSSIFKKIHSFTADRESLSYLHRYLTDIRDEVPDDDGEREIAELRKVTNEGWDQWRAHLQYLMGRLERLIAECNA